jgi:hypothetical protein
MSIATIGTGLKTRLDTITGLRVFAPNELPGTANELPSAFIIPAGVEYHNDFSANYSVTFRVVVAVTQQDEATAHDALLDYMEPTGTYSVLAAIEADKTLSSTADTVRTVRNLGIRTWSMGGIDYLATEFEVVVYA